MCAANRGAKKRSTNVLFIIGIVVASVLSGYSLYLIITLTWYLDVDEVMLKQGAFSIINQEYEFDIISLGNKEYEIQMECYRPKTKDGGYASLVKEILWKDVNLTAEIQLHDTHGAVLKKEILFSGGTYKIVPQGFAEESFTLILSSFKAKKSEKYRLKIAFGDGDDLFDNLSKELIVVKKHDKAALPATGLFLVIAIAVFLLCISALIVMAIKRRNMMRRLG